MSEYCSGPFELSIITNRGVKVYPGGIPETFCTDHWRCRFTSSDMDKAVGFEHVIWIQEMLFNAKFDIIKIENLYRFDGKIAFSLGQGQ